MTTLEELATDFYQDLMRMALSICWNPSDAEDVVQETFLKVLQTPNKPPDKDLKPWMRQIMRNAIIEIWRRQTRHGKMKVMSLSDYMHLFATEEIQWDTDYIIKAIDELPKCYREVARLHIIEGLTPTQIAEKLKILVSTAGTKVTRSKAMLRERIVDGEYTGVPKEPVNRQDVADRVGLTCTAISKILGGQHERFNKHTVERVLDVAQELGYKPEAVAAVRASVQPK
jgi:RNA polymerase sigma-70 factor (ECF subfamily)